MAEDPRKRGDGSVSGEVVKKDLIHISANVSIFYTLFQLFLSYLACFLQIIRNKSQRMVLLGRKPIWMSFPRSSIKNWTPWRLRPCRRRQSIPVNRTRWTAPAPTSCSLLRTSGTCPGRLCSPIPSEIVGWRFRIRVSFRDCDVTELLRLHALVSFRKYVLCDSCFDLNVRYLIEGPVFCPFAPLTIQLTSSSVKKWIQTNRSLLCFVS